MIPNWPATRNTCVAEQSSEQRRTRHLMKCAVFVSDKRRTSEENGKHTTESSADTHAQCDQPAARPARHAPVDPARARRPQFVDQGGGCTPAAQHRQPGGCPGNDRTVWSLMRSQHVCARRLGTETEKDRNRAAHDYQNQEANHQTTNCGDAINRQADDKPEQSQSNCPAAPTSGVAACPGRS